MREQEAEARPGDVRRLGFLPWAWLMAGVGFLNLFLMAGPRSTFSVFLKPLAQDFGWSRSSLSLAASIHSLVYGLIQPLSGRLADRLGPKGVIVVGLVLGGLAALGLSALSHLYQLYILYGVMVGLAVGTAGHVSHNALVARWFRKGRGSAMSIVASGASAGQVLVIPLAMYLMLTLGWRWAYGLLALPVLVIALPLSLFALRNNPPGEAEAETKARAADPSRLRGALGRALSSRTFWLAGIAYTVCGLTDSMVHIHLVPAGLDLGLKEMEAATVLALFNAMSATGLVVFGPISDRFGRRFPLLSLYLLRAIAFIVLARTGEPSVFYLTAGLAGLTNLATLPITATLLADVYGTAAAGTLFGLVAFSHSVGLSAGAYLAGYIYDASGSYSWAFTMGAGALLLAGVASLLLREARAPSPGAGLPAQ